MKILYFAVPRAGKAFSVVYRPTDKKTNEQFICKCYDKDTADMICKALNSDGNG